MDKNESSAIRSRIPKWFWVVSGVSLLWNLMGLLAFVAGIMTPAEKMSTDPEVQKLFSNLPAWYYVVFAVAVVAGTLGCVGLLMRAKWALPVLIISLLGVIAQQCYMYFMSDTLNVMGSSAAIMPTVVLIIGIALICFSRMATSKGWLH